MGRRLDIEPERENPLPFIGDTRYAEQPLSASVTGVPDLTLPPLALARIDHGARNAPINLLEGGFRGLRVVLLRFGIRQGDLLTSRPLWVSCRVSMGNEPSRGRSLAKH